MSSSGGIGGNFETSVLFDVSGVRTGSEIFVNQMHIMEGAANRTSATLQAASARTVDYSQSIDRAAEMVELLALKMLTLQANSERAGASAKKMAADFTGAATSGRSLTDMMNGGSLAAKKAADALELYNKNLELSRQNTGVKTGVSLPGDGRSLTAAMMGGSLAHANQQEESVAAEQALRDREARLQRAREMDIRAIQEDKAFMDRASNEKVDRLRRDAQIENDIEDQRLADMRARYNERIQAEGRYERARIRHNYRIQQDANRFAAGARPAPEMRTSPDQINPRFFQMSRDLRAWERGRVAAEAVRNAVRETRIALDPMVGMQIRLANEADEFAENMERAVRANHITQANADRLLVTYQQLTEQQMRQARAQQLSFFGMRNLGFAAQQGAYAIEDFAQVFGTMGVAGGIRAAGNNLTAMASTMGPMVGVFASLAAAGAMLALHMWETSDATKEAEEAEEKRLELLESMEDVYRKQIEYEREMASLRKGSITDLGSAIPKLQEQLDDQIVNARVKSVEDSQKRVDEMKAEIDSIMKTKIADDAIAGAAGPRLINPVANVALAGLRELIPSLLKDPVVENNMQIKEMLSKAVEERIAALEKEIALVEQLDSAENRRLERERQREVILNRANELLNAGVPVLDNMVNLQLQYAAISQQRFEAEEAENERVRIAVDLAERMLELQEEGKKAAESVRDSLISRIGGLNEEFRHEQEILKTRKEINEEIEKALRAGTISKEQAADARRHLEEVLEFENDRFMAEKRIEELQEREKTLREKLSNNQTPTQLGGAVVRGSAQAIQILEQDRMNQLTKKENQPVVDELRRILQEIKLQREELKNIANTEFDVASLEGF